MPTVSAQRCQAVPTSVGRQQGNLTHNNERTEDGKGEASRLPKVSTAFHWQPNAVSQSVDLGRSNNPNTTPTKDYKIVRVVVYLCGVQRGCAEEGERGSTPTG